MIQLPLPMLVVLLLATFACTLIAAEPKSEAGFPKVKHMIDTHIHLYDTSRKQGVPWPPKNDKVLYKPHLPTEFKKVSKPTKLTGVVIVEASDRLADNKWVLDLVKDDDYFIALVGNIDPYRDDFETQLLKLKKDKRFVGIRARNPKRIDYKNPQVLKNFKILAKHNMSLDILANGEGLKAVQQVDRLAKSIPQLRIIVDHVLGYNPDGKKPSAKWIAAVEKLAKNPNVYCKVSGLYQNSVRQPAPQDDQYYSELLDVLWSSFGHQRLVFGSNWPCTKKSGDYSSFVRLVNRYFSKKGQTACEHYFWKNANKAYNLGLK